MILKLGNLHKCFTINGAKRHILDDITLACPVGSVTSITGRSGCGKSTLLNCIAGLVRPSSGSVEIMGNRLIHFCDIMPSLYRNRHIGFVFQTFRLVSELTLLDNVLLPVRMRGRVSPEKKEHALDLLSMTGLYKYRHSRVSVLSGGQKQRTAVARALVHRPSLLLADEPTANLDERTSEEIFELLHSQVGKDRALVIVTHKGSMHRMSDAVYELVSGRLVLS